MHDPRSNLRYWMPLVLWILSILLVSSIPGSTMSRVGFEVQDKVAHFLEYSILGFLVGRWERNQYGHGWIRSVVTSLLLGSSIALLDEAYQGWIPGRTPSAMDWLADLAGISLGLAFSLIRYRDGRSREATATKDEVS